jgi:hypothetical protein
MLPAKMKKGIAIRLKESIPPKIRVMTRDNGIPIAKATSIDEIQIARKMGNPKKIRAIKKKSKEDVGHGYPF